MKRDNYELSFSFSFPRLEGNLSLVEIVPGPSSLVEFSMANDIRLIDWSLFRSYISVDVRNFRGGPSDRLGVRR